MSQHHQVFPLVLSNKELHLLIDLGSFDQELIDDHLDVVEFYCLLHMDQ
jgi:hypothetical protein